MKRMAPLAALLLLSLPLLAAEEKPVQKPKTEAPSPAAQPAAAAQAAPAAPEATKLAIEAPAEGDSPLVALAKRSPKTPKKGSIVINNANLGGKNAKVTTTASQRPLNVGTKSEDESDSANNVVGVVDQLNKNKEKTAPADKKPLTEAEKAKRMEAMRAKLENDSLDFDEGDPARVEHQLEQTSKAKTQTQTTADPKKP